MTKCASVDIGKVCELHLAVKEGVTMVVWDEVQRVIWKIEGEESHFAS